jgi:hypothetical protein
MRCGLLLPHDVASLQLDPVGPVLTAEILISWPGQAGHIRFPAVVDTGCPVDLVASADLATRLRCAGRPFRMETLDWGGRLDTEVYVADLKLGEWTRTEVHVPTQPFEETLLGLRALLKANLCLRGEDRSAYWARLPAAGDAWDFISRDAEGAPRAAAPPKTSRRRRAKVAR